MTLSLLSFGLLQDEAAADQMKELEELLSQPLPLLGIGAVALVFGLFLVPLRMAIMRRCVEPAVPARPAFEWTDLLAVIAAFVVAQTAALYGAVRSIHGSWPEGDDFDAVVEKMTFLDQASVQSITFLGVCLLIIGVALSRTEGMATLGFRRPAPARFPLGRTVGGLSSYFLSLPLLFAAGAATTAAYAFGGEEPPMQEVAVAIQEQLEAYPLVIVFFAAVLIPLLEEILFRGFMLELFTGKLGRAAGVILSSAIFAIMHGVAAAPVIFVLAVVLALVKLRTRSLMVVWLMHGMHNGLTVLLQAQGAE